MIERTTSKILLLEEDSLGNGKELVIGMRANRLIFTRKLVIWLMIFLLQVLFLGSYWFMPSGIESNSALDVIVGTQKWQLIPVEEKLLNSNVRQSKINFITKVASLKNWRVGKKRNEDKLIYSKQKIKLKNLNRYEEDFVLQTLDFNRTEEEIALNIWNNTEEQWCFMEGLENNHLSYSNRPNKEEFDSNHCKCRSGWHGKDCGQPEVIWRGLMTAKHQPFQIRKLFINKSKNGKSHSEPNNLIAFIEGRFLNLDMLELQLASIVKVVDYFMLFLKINRNIQKTYDYKSLHKRLKDIFKNDQRYELYSCNTFKETSSNLSQCASQKAFRTMLQRIETPKPTDLVLHLPEHTIISTAALKFLKYYGDNVDFVRFRLKFNVYGYFWQHEKQTHLNGLLSSFLHLDNQQGDFEKLYKRALATNSLALIIGDLNHFGGWYCEYCLQPNEIVLELHLINASSFNQQKQLKQHQQQQQQQQQEQKFLFKDHHEIEQKSIIGYLQQSNNNVIFPNVTKNQNIIDIEYIQKLISNGMHLDGKTKLVKVRTLQDKYYAPAYAQEHSWKYGSFLVNLYESLDEDEDEENEIIVGYN